MFWMAPGEFLSAYDAIASSTLSSDAQSVMGSDAKEALVPSKSAKASQPRWDAWGASSGICWDQMGSIHLGLTVEVKKNGKQNENCSTSFYF
jgi:hypothetical protein